MEAYVILEDGTMFKGECIAPFDETVSELVFNTSMTGYLEVLTDPSYAGQSVVMTYPLIGNYGVCFDDQESNDSYVLGFIVNELSELGSHFRKNIDLKEYLISKNIPCIQGVDTRHLTQIIRKKGCMNVMMTTHYYDDLSDVLEKIQSYRVKDVVSLTTCKSTYTVGKGKKVALLDYGCKKSIVKNLVNEGLEVTVFPSYTKAQEIIDCGFEGIMLSNGPGDPSENIEIIEEIKKLVESNIPIFAICLGHQLMALAHGIQTKKLQFGHHGVNHPVIDLNTNNVYITSQNHNYVIDESSIDLSICEKWFINVNDKTIEGLTYLHHPIKTVQFHPEACGGPEDTHYLFKEFMKMMEDK